MSLEVGEDALGEQQLGSGRWIALLQSITVARGGGSQTGADFRFAQSRAVGQQILIEGLLCVRLWLRRERRKRYYESNQHLP